MAALFTIEQVVLTEVTVLSTGASLANNVGALSSAFNNVNAGTAGFLGYRRGKFRFSGTFAAAPTANGAIVLYAVKGDSAGSVYETSSVTPPPGLPLAAIAIDSTNTTQVRDSDDVDLPGGFFKVMAVNAATGQTISSGWTLTIEAITDAGF